MRTIGILLLVVGVLATSAGQDKVGQEPAKHRKGKFTVGKETTYITGPLDKDGYVDYAAALNERLRKGVTPENNANVLLWKALGPPSVGEKFSVEFFRRLGIPAPPERGLYFTDLFRYAKENTKIDVKKAAGLLLEQLESAGHRPWKESDYPLLADWLKANQQPLLLVVAATRLPHYYSPLIPGRTEKGPAGLTSAPLPGVQRYRELVAALTARAMLRVGQGDADGAWQDLLACHRLGRVIARGGTLIEYLLGLALDNIASESDLVFLAATRPGARRVAGYLRDLQRLPAWPAQADLVDLTDRFTFLESVTLIDRGIPVLAGLLGESDANPSARGERKCQVVDWDPALRNFNRWFDRLASALRETDRAERVKQLNRIESESETLKRKLVDSGEAARLLAEESSPQIVGQAVSDALICQWAPKVSKVQGGADRIRQIQNNLHLAFALEWYRGEKGNYPRKLDALTPRYMKEIPRDMFSGKALIYRPTAEGYLLYSVGPNGRDDGGRGYDDPPGDDVSVRMPLPIP
jgi:hypothetical protein